jgi:hypothetical protein
MAEQDRELIRLHETVIRLREENDALRRSAGAFAELAERLSSALREERQSGLDPQSSRKATIGSTRDARLAGT